MFGACVDMRLNEVVCRRLMFDGRTGICAIWCTRLSIHVTIVSVISSHARIGNLPLDSCKAASVNSLCDMGFPREEAACCRAYGPNGKNTSKI